MKRILIHSLVFHPDGVSTAYLYNDIALGFKNNGFRVTVLTTTPHYNYSGRICERNGFRKRFFGLFYESLFFGIKVYHIPVRKFHSTFLRLMTFVYWHFISVLIGLLFIRFDYVIAPSPPLTIGLVAVIMSKLKNAKAIYNVQEIYPDLLINQNQLKSSWLIFMLKKLERFIYNFSDLIITIDQVFYDQIVSRINNIEKLKIIPNFVDTELFRSQKPFVGFIKNKFYEADNLKIMYAGNIGHAQDWDLLIEIAKKLKGYKVDFYIIGEGAKKNYVLEHISKNNLKNIKMFPYQPFDLMPGINSFADVHIILMNQSLSKLGFPSKIFNILACGKPVIVSSSAESPLIKLLSPLNVGYLSTENDNLKASREISEFIINYLHNKDLLKLHSNKARNFILEKYSKQSVIKKYIQIVNSL